MGILNWEPDFHKYNLFLTCLNYLVLLITYISSPVWRNMLDFNKISTTSWDYQIMIVISSGSSVLHLGLHDNFFRNVRNDMISVIKTYRDLLILDESIIIKNLWYSIFKKLSTDIDLIFTLLVSTACKMLLLNSYLNHNSQSQRALTDRSFACFTRWPPTFRIFSLKWQIMMITHVCC